MSGDGTAVGVVVKQIAIVVRDLDATMREYHRAFAWGPWRIYDFRHLPHHDTHVRGKVVAYSMRTAVTRVGGVDLELVEPLEGPSQYQEFLDQKGEGLHHIMCQDSDGGSTRRARRVKCCAREMAPITRLVPLDQRLLLGPISG
jgi:methylmalonyl-CoA/ethylmalonyl-CoA epimerase